MAESTVSLLQHYSCSSESAKTFAECSDLGPSGIDNGCYYNDIVSQYRSCYNLCHGKTVDTRDGLKCVYRCKYYVKSSCEMLLPTTTTSTPLTSTEASLDLSYIYIILAGIVPLLVFVALLFIVLHLFKRRQMTQRCFLCKGKPNCFMCWIADRICWSRYAIRQPTIGIPTDVDAHQPIDPEVPEDGVDEALPIEADTASILTV